MLRIALVILLGLAATVSAQLDDYAYWVEEDVAVGEAGKRMAEFMHRLEPYGFHGAVLVAQHDSVLLHRAYGLADPVLGIPNTTATAFSTGSVTKQFTAAAILLLHQEFLIDPEDPIDRFFGDVPPDKSGITLHHLLTHTSGLAPSYGMDSEEIDRETMMRRIFSAPLEFPVGQEYSYSNAGYSVLAAVVEIVSGMEYEVFLRERLFKPNWMRQSGLHLPLFREGEIGISHNAAMGYPSPADRPHQAWNITGNGGILATAADMFRWHLALKRNRQLEPEYAQMLFTPYVAEGPEGESFYGYGWVVQQSRTGDTVIWHNGGAMPHGWSCAVYWYQEADAVFIVFANALFNGKMPVDQVAVTLSSLLFEDREVILPPLLIDLPVDVTGYKTIYKAGEAKFEVTGDGPDFLVTPVGQPAVDILMPSPYGPRLAKYGGKTTQLFELMAEGKFEEAATQAQFAVGDDGGRLLAEWWQLFDSLGGWQNTAVLGTVVGGAVQTYVRLKFAEGVVNAHVGWDPPGICVGIADGFSLNQRFRATKTGLFAMYDLGGPPVTIDFRDREMVIETADGEITAQKVD